MRLKKKNFISFYKSYSYERNRMLYENLRMKSVFPHFIISDKPMEDDIFISKINNRWSVYQSHIYFNFGLNSFYKLGIFIDRAKKLEDGLEEYKSFFLDKGYSLIKARRMALESVLYDMKNELDVGLKKMDMSFILFFGKKQYIFDDIKILANTAINNERLKNRHDVITNLYLLNDSAELKKKLLMRLLHRQKLYEKILTGKSEFDIDLLLTSTIPISIVSKDYEFERKKISNVLQIPIGWESYYYVMKEYFGVDIDDKNQVQSIYINGREFELFSVDNDVFVYNNIFIVDKNRAVITGRARDIFSCLLDKKMS